MKSQHIWWNVNGQNYQAATKQSQEFILFTQNLWKKILYSILGKSQKCSGCVSRQIYQDIAILKSLPTQPFEG